jgi:hypothetical protein
LPALWGQRYLEEEETMRYWCLLFHFHFFSFFLTKR